MIGIHDDRAVDDGIAARFRARADDAREVMARSLTIEPGTMSDYEALSRFHYRGGRPAAVTNVDRLVRRTSTVVGRYLHRTGEAQVVGVLVRTLPPLNSMLRTIATGDRYAGLSRRQTAALLNREVRTIARVVIDPTWRGLGLAVRLVRHALDHAQTVYTESFAAMGRAHPFFEKAGMTRYDRPPHAGEQRLLDAFEAAGIDPIGLATPDVVAQRIDLLPAAQRTWIEHECRRWARTVGRRSNGDDESLASILALAGRRLLARPVYYLARRADGASDSGAGKCVRRR